MKLPDRTNDPQWQKLKTELETMTNTVRALRMSLAKTATPKKKKIVTPQVEPPWEYGIYRGAYRPVITKKR